MFLEMMTFNHYSLIKNPDFLSLQQSKCWLIKKRSWSVNRIFRDNVVRLRLRQFNSYYTRLQNSI